MSVEPTTLYLISAIAAGGLITIALRALPFAVLKKLRKSTYVKKLGMWMPVGIMLILAATTATSSFKKYPELWWSVPVTLVITAGVHIVSKRNTTLSVLTGTLLYVFIVNVLV